MREHETIKDNNRLQKTKIKQKTTTDNNRPQKTTETT